MATLGGLYRFEEQDGVLVATGPILRIDRPSGAVFDDDGDLWIVRDFGAREGAHVFKVLAPSDGGVQTEDVIAQFQSPADDDPFAIKIAPEGFESELVSPGDVVIADRGVETNAPHAFYVYSRDAPVGDPLAYSEFLLPVGALSAYNGTNMADSRLHARWQRTPRALQQR